MPGEAMRESIARAEVGDDVFGEDPSVNRLQEMAAERMGKEETLFVTSGAATASAGMRYTSGTAATSSSTRGVIVPA